MLTIESTGNRRGRFPRGKTDVGSTLLYYIMPRLEKYFFSSVSIISIARFEQSEVRSDVRLVSLKGSEPPIRPAPA